MPYKPPKSTGDRTHNTRPESPKKNEEVKETEIPDYLFSYYQSSIPNQRPSHLEHARNHSTTSTSSSDYSYDSDARDAGSEASTGVTRRVATPSKGGADRRRVAIVQMDPLTREGGSSNSMAPPSHLPTGSSLRSRRGHKSDLTGLALVAPPDASPRTYTHLTPPLSAPLTSEYIPQTAIYLTSLSRDREAPNLEQNEMIITKNTKDNNNQNPSRIRGSPRSRSQSPTHPQPSPGDNARGFLITPRTSRLPLTHSPMFSPVTPDIGQPKDIHVPVAGPVVVNLGLQSRKTPLSTSSRTNSPLPNTSLLGTPASSYLHYQPGVHLTAGPLPPSPRANFNIDIHSPPPPRPPRLHSPAITRPKHDIDAVKQALQLPPSVTAILSSKSSNFLITKSYKEDLRSESSDVDSKLEIKKPSSELSTTSAHRREGAFSPLEDIPVESTSPATVSGSTTAKLLESSNTENKETTTEVSGVVPTVTVIKLPSHSNTLPADIDHRKFSEWLRSNPELSQPLGNKQRKSGSVDETHKQKPSESPERSMSGSDAPSPPPKSFRNSLTTNLKRLSLSRTTSLSSKSGRRRSHNSSRTPSPSLRRMSPPPEFQKIRSANPAALFCHEVHTQRTPSERCLIYATKINELYLYDCGLEEWVINMKLRGPNTQHQRAPSTQPFAPQLRHTSRSSMVSEATFPRRPDASIATDLSQGTYGDITPTAVSLTLPYPSLAMNPPRANPSRSNSSVGTPPSSLAPSTSTSKSGGFFASLGRKASLSKKEKPNNTLVSPSSGSLSSASGSGRLLSKHTPSPSMGVNVLRPINITSPPSVPGGPRAPPGRPQRSHTFTPSFPPAPAIVNSDLGRRPSMFDLTIDIRPDTEFYQQVDKLTSLLPHANRDVLAGYLRHTGQDMLAIGQYLEDEKNGTIRLYD